MKLSNKQATTIILAFLCSMNPLNTHAQEKLGKRHELYFSAGGGNTMLTDNMNKRTDKISYSPKSNIDCGIDCGPIGCSLDYKYRLTKRFSTGISIGYSYDSEGYSESTGKDGSIYEASLTYTMPSLSYTWYKTDNERFRIYSGVGLGFAFLHENVNVAEYQVHANSLKLAYNATFAGITVGGQHVKFFSEFNYGCKNIFTLGMEVRI